MADARRPASPAAPPRPTAPDGGGTPDPTLDATTAWRRSSPAAQRDLVRLGLLRRGLREPPPPPLPPAQRRRNNIPSCPCAAISPLPPHAFALLVHGGGFGCGGNDVAAGRPCCSPVSSVRLLGPCLHTRDGVLSARRDGPHTQTSGARARRTHAPSRTPRAAPALSLSLSLLPRSLARSRSTGRGGGREAARPRGRTPSSGGGSSSGGGGGRSSTRPWMR